MKTALKWSLVPLTIMNITIKAKIITKLYGLKNDSLVYIEFSLVSIGKMFL